MCVFAWANRVRKMNNFPLGRHQICFINAAFYTLVFHESFSFSLFFLPRCLTLTWLSPVSICIWRHWRHWHWLSINF